MVVGVDDGWRVGLGDMGRVVVVVVTGGITGGDDVGGAVLEEIGTVDGDRIVMVGPSVSFPNVEISTYVTIDPTKIPTMMSSNNIQHRLL